MTYEPIVYDKSIKFMAWTKKFQQLYTWDKLEKKFSFNDFNDPDLTWYRFTGYKSPNKTDIYAGHILKTDEAINNTLNEIYVIKETNGLLMAEFRFRQTDGQVIKLEVPVINIIKYVEVIGHITTDPELLEETK